MGKTCKTKSHGLTEKKKKNPTLCKKWTLVIDLLCHFRRKQSNNTEVIPIAHTFTTGCLSDRQTVLRRVTHSPRYSPNCLMSETKKKQIFFHSCFRSVQGHVSTYFFRVSICKWFTSPHRWGFSRDLSRDQLLKSKFIQCLTLLYMAETCKRLQNERQITICRTTLMVRMLSVISTKPYSWSL